ncbi:MAG: hypothetical protein R3E90_03095 [Marinicella sp.]|nr:hypothetical protein [Xanthomonadales bacterium]
MRGICSSQKVSMGFTLLEILLVVLIIGIMTVVGANVINSQSPERNIMDAAAQFQTELQYMCDLSVLENRAHGLEWTDSGRFWLTHHAGDWVLTQNNQVADPSLFKQQILLDGLIQRLESEPEELPHIICQTDGSHNAFEVRWLLAEEADGGYYALKSETPWQLSGAWVEH